MGTSVGVGYSTHRNSAEAGREAARHAIDQAGITAADFVFVFATVGHDQESLVRSVREATGAARLSGCSGEGVITQGIAAESNFNVAVMAIRSDELRFENVSLPGEESSPEATGARLAAELRTLIRADTMACFLFADGLSFDFEPLLHSVDLGLLEGNKLPIFGGLASDNWSSRRTYQYHDDQVFSGGISAVLLSGAGMIAWGVNHGCLPVGTKRTITKSRNNVIYEIDHLPALEALKDYFDEDVATQWNKLTLNLCLGFKTPEPLKKEYDEYVIRYMMGKDDKVGSVTIQSDVQEGTDLWIVRRDQDRMRAGLQVIARQIRERGGARTPKMVLQFECVGRGKVVFREQEKLQLLRELQVEVGADVPWIGFYTYGEIAPIAHYNFLHNFSAVVTAIY